MKTLRLKILAFLVLPIFLIFLGNILILQLVVVPDMNKRIKDRSTSALDELARDVKARLYFPNSLEEITLLMFDKKSSGYNMDYVIFYDKEAKPIAHTFIGEVPVSVVEDTTALSEKNSRYISYEGKKELEISTPIYSGIYRIGYIRIGYNYDEMSSRIIKSNYYLFAFIAIMGLGATILAFYLARSITGPMVSLTTALGVFEKSKRKLSVNTFGNKNNEIGNLIRAFDVMTSHLLSTDNELAAQKADISKKVVQLERMNRALVGREQKMIDLKKALADKVKQK